MKTTLTCVLFVAAVFFLPSAFPQGSLTPPGTPAPTMKTLDQLDTLIGKVGEQRTPVNTANTPGDSSNSFIISQAGSYYLTDNINGVAAKNGISIQADNVTLDLNGFTLGLVGSTTKNGIDIPSSQSNITIRNGVIGNWKNGVNGPLALSCRLENLEATGNTGAGFTLAQGAFVKGCVSASNTGDGIDVRDNSTIIDCLSRANGGIGIFTNGNGAAIQSCTADANQGAGINAGGGSVVAGCAAQFNHGGGIVSSGGCTISHCTVDQNTGIGIIPGPASTVSQCTVTRSSTDGINGAGLSDVAVTGCTVAFNTSNGVVLGPGGRLIGSNSSLNGATGVQVGLQSSVHDCTVTGNTGEGVLLTSADDCINNNISGNTNGIHAISTGGVGFGNRIDGNQVRDNTTAGIVVDVASAHNLIVRNSAGNNNGTNNYNIAIGNKVGPIVTDPSASTANAWANFVDP